MIGHILYRAGKHEEAVPPHETRIFGKCSGHVSHGSFVAHDVQRTGNLLKIKPRHSFPAARSACLQRHYMLRYRLRFIMATKRKVTSRARPKTSTKKKTPEWKQTFVDFRCWMHEPGIVMAFLPTIPADKHGVRIGPQRGALRDNRIVLCYEHIDSNAPSPYRQGFRKSGENYFDMVMKTRPATPKEYAPLLAYLKEKGFELRVTRYASSVGGVPPHRR